MRGYDLHQSSTPSFDHGRFVVLFVTTRSSARLTHILQTAARIMRNPKRTLFLGVTLTVFLSHGEPLTAPLFLSPTGRAQNLIPDDPVSARMSDRDVGRTARPSKTPTPVPIAA